MEGIDRKHTHDRRKLGISIDYLIILYIYIIIIIFYFIHKIYICHINSGVKIILIKMYIFAPIGRLIIRNIPLFKIWSYLNS